MKGEIVLIPRGSIRAIDLKFLRKRGVNAVEVEDPSKVITLGPAMAQPADKVLLCALRAITGYGSEQIQARFCRNYLELLEKSTPADSAKEGAREG